MLLFSLIARDYMLWFLIPWLVIELIRIALGNYGRVKTNQKIDFNNFRELLLSKSSGIYKAIFAGVSVLTIVMILAFSPRTDLNAESAMVSGSDAVSGSEITISATDTTTATTSKKTKATEKTTTKKTTEATTTTTSSKKTKNILMDAQIRECPVMNGTKTERIGTYAYIITDKELLKKTCSEADYIEFLNKRVKDSGYNWFTIVFEDNTGIQYGGSYIYQGTYSKLDQDRCITKAIGDVFLEDGKVTYEKDNHSIIKNPLSARDQTSDRGKSKPSPRARSIIMIAHFSRGVKLFSKSGEEFFDGAEQTVQSSDLRPLQFSGAA